MSIISFFLFDVFEREYIIHPIGNGIFKIFATMSTEVLISSDSCYLLLNLFSMYLEFNSDLLSYPMSY